MKYQCPECGSFTVVVTEETSYYIDTLELFCHSVKSHDEDAKVRCINCRFEGVRKDFEVKNELQ